jgi:glutamine cyclotransferase
MRWLVALIIVLAIGALAAWAQYGTQRIPRLQEARVVAAFPHDPRAFTQGLIFHNGWMYEGTGQYGASSIRKVNYVTGTVEQMSSLNRAYFGEGITILGDKLYQLTWLNQVGAVYDVETFNLLTTFMYDGEGWGLTNDGRELILSDGTAVIRFLDPETFAVTRRIEVRDDGRAIERLNELEYIRGEIWANIWYEDRIARISPEDGRVLGWIDVSRIYPRSRRSSEEVANGIAYNAETDQLYVTGKNWPQLFEIELVDPSGD